MAKVTSPLFSMSASGALGKALVYASWKGINTVRQFTTPTNPQSTAQTTQRGYLSAVTSFWRSTLTNAAQRTGWAVAAAQDARTLSGFNLFSSNALAGLAGDGDCSFVTTVSGATTAALEFTLKRAADGEEADETGDFSLYVGTTATNLALVGAEALASGELIVTSAVGTAGDYYCQIVKDAGTVENVARSGIFLVTVTSA